MRIISNVNKTTLDSFNRDVYRPRLALILLIVLLIIGQHDEQGRRISSSSSSSSVGSGSNFASKYTQGTVNTQTGAFKVAKHLQPLLDRVPKRLRLDKNVVAVKWTNANTAQSTKVANEAAPTSSKGGIKQQQQQSSSDFLSSLLRKRQQAKSSSTASFISRLANANAIAAIATLHILWAIRLMAMLLEDVLIGKDSSHAKHNSASHKFAIVLLAALAIISASTFPLTHLLERIGISSSKTVEISKTTLLAIRMIIVLELSATLASLIAPICRMQYRRIPRKVSLPSPSHSPAIVDMLPIPPGLANALKGVPATTTTSAAFPGSHVRQRRLAAAAATAHFQGQPQGQSRIAPAVAPPAPAAPIVPRQGMPSHVLAEPLRLPDGMSPGKVPRLQGMRVNVDTVWLAEQSITAYGHLVGALQYFVVAFALPTLAPTSFPSLLSLLSLRSELSAITTCWSNARKAVECLEFVQRRWATKIVNAGEQTEATSTAAEVCSICYEDVILERDIDRKSSDDCCTLDCGHQLHSQCLVQWLAKQAFCPFCHATLKATPPQQTSRQEQTAQ